MKYIATLNGSTRGAVRAFANRNGYSEKYAETYRHPKEDHLLVNDDPPVFVVADGVTLDHKKLTELNEPYPDPSPAGEVARIFCEGVVRAARERYDSFNTDAIVGVFSDANAAVRAYNDAVGQSDISGNVTGYFAATGAFVVVKDGRAYWATICDAFVGHFDRDMRRRFVSSGTCEPYAVVNGEARMEAHLETGVFDLTEGDRVFVYTDGYEHYVSDPEFQRLFRAWDASLESRIAAHEKVMDEHDPEKFGHERSLIAIRP